MGENPVISDITRQPIHAGGGEREREGGGGGGGEREREEGRGKREDMMYI